MPAVSQAQQRAMAIAEHSPEKLYKRNQDLARMKKRSLHEFASTSRKDLPLRSKRTESRRKGSRS